MFRSFETQGARIKYDRVLFIPDKNFTFISVTSQEKINEIWKPDIFFSNDRESHFHDPLSHNQYLRIFPDGEIHHSVR